MLQNLSSAAVMIAALRKVILTLSMLAVTFRLLITFATCNSLDTDQD